MNPPNPVGRPVTKKREEKQEGYVILDVDVTDTASAVCARAEKTANARRKPVRFTINGIPMVAELGEDGDELFSRWWRLFREEERKKSAEAQRAFDCTLEA